jgi:Putative transposase
MEMHYEWRFERLARYVGRPPLAAERLSLLRDGRLLYRLKHRWRDGTTHVIYEPLELLERLAALVPPPKFNIVRYSGVFAHAKSAAGL